MALKPFSRSRRLRTATWLFAAASLSLSPAFAQEEGPDAPGPDETGYSSLDVSAPKGTRELQNALQRLALNPADVDALIDGGNAALLLGDPQAAIGFFARADEMSPGNGRVKAGLGSSLLLNENPYEALRLFEEAKRLGVPETVFASDRGLAYDLVGNSNAAQADYELALRRGGDDETIRRYALSLGISGDRAAAEAQLDPLLRKRDAAAWRTRAFVLAVSGDAEGAIAIADATMPRRMAASIQPFFRFMGKLTPAQQAAAAHFGQFPQSAAIGKDDPRNRQYASAGSPRVRSNRADAGLIPAGEPLGPTTDSKARKVAKVDKSQRRRPGRLSKKEREAIALAQAEAAAKPVPVQTRPPGPVPPPDLLIPGRGTGASDTGGNVQTARATVQPLPGSYASSQPSRAIVQPLPGSSAQAPAPRSAEPAPVRLAAAPADAGQTAPETPRGAVRVDAMPSGETAAAQSAAAARTARLEAVQAKVATAKPVLLPGVKELPKPGFDSLGSTASTPPAPVPSQAASSSLAAATQPTTLLPPAMQATQTVQPAQPGPGAPQAFDLAQIGPPVPAPATAAPVASAPSTLAGAAPAPATVQPVPAAPEPEPVSLAAVIASIQVPAAELAPSADAVDITKLPAVIKKPDETDAAKKAEEKKVADKLAADKLAADKKAADKKAAEDKKLAEKKAAEKKAAAAKKAAPKHPKRYWVQVAGGANRADLSKEWKRLISTSPAVFKGKQGWWTPLNATNRLLTGPFGSSAEAQAFVNTLSKNKLSGFSFTSSEGQEVTKLGG